MELAQRVTHQAELIDRWLELVAVTAGECRPGFRRRANALARLCEHRRVVQTETRHVVIDRVVAIQTKGQAHGIQCRCHRLRRTVAGRLGLRAEEQQLMHQAIRNRAITLGQRCVLQQHARSDTLHKDIGVQKPCDQRLEEAAADLPERTDLAIRLARREALAQQEQLGIRALIGGLDDAQHGTVELGTRLGVVGLRRHRDGDVRFTETAFDGPQIGRMHTFHTVQRLRFAVLRKQGHGGHLLAGQYAFQIRNQRKAGALDGVGRRIRAELWALHVFLNCGFQRTQDQGW